MLTAAQSFQQSCWQRFGNIPSILTGITTGGVVAFIVCCAGPAAIGAAIGGGTAVGTGATVGIIASSTIGGCVVGMGINKCLRKCKSHMKGYFALTTTEPTSETTVEHGCCSVVPTPGSPSIVIRSTANALHEQNEEALDGNTFHPSFSGKKHKASALSSKVSSCKEAMRERSIRQNKLS